MKESRRAKSKKQNTVKEKQIVDCFFRNFWTCTKFWLCFLFCFCFGDMYSHWKHSHAYTLTPHRSLSIYFNFQHTHTHIHKTTPTTKNTTSTNGTTRWLSKLFAWPPLLFKLPSLATDFPVDGELRLKYILINWFQPLIRYKTKKICKKNNNIQTHTQHGIKNSHLVHMMKLMIVILFLGVQCSLFM